jgi:hypothetical protein
VEWSHGSGGLQGQHYSRRRLLFWAWCNRTFATEVQTAISDPFTWMQTWRLWILPQPQGGWSFHTNTGLCVTKVAQRAPLRSGWAKALGFYQPTVPNIGYTLAQTS